MFTEQKEIMILGQANEVVCNQLVCFYYPMIFLIKRPIMKMLPHSSYITLENVA